MFGHDATEMSCVCEIDPRMDIPQRLPNRGPTNCRTQIGAETRRASGCYFSELD